VHHDIRAGFHNQGFTLSAKLKICCPNVLLNKTDDHVDS